MLLVVQTNFISQNIRQFLIIINISFKMVTTYKLELERLFSETKIG